MKTTRLTSFILILFVSLLATKGQALANIPQHTANFYVNDFANVLSEQTINHIIDSNKLFIERSRGEIVVTTVDSTDGIDIDQYAMQMYNEWGIGDAHFNKGLLLLLVIGQDDYFVVTGDGMDNIISDEELDRILNTHLEPYFNSGRYDLGVLITFSNMFQAVSKFYIPYTPVDMGVTSEPVERVNTTQVSESSKGMFWAIFITIIVILVVVVKLYIKSIEKKNLEIQRVREKYEMKIKRRRELNGLGSDNTIQAINNDTQDVNLGVPYNFKGDTNSPPTYNHINNNIHLEEECAYSSHAEQEESRINNMLFGAAAAVGTQKAINSRRNSKEERNTNSQDSSRNTRLFGRDSSPSTSSTRSLFGRSSSPGGGRSSGGGVGRSSSRDSSSSSNSSSSSSNSSSSRWSSSSSRSSSSSSNSNSSSSRSSSSSSRSGGGSSSGGGVGRRR